MYKNPFEKGQLIISFTVVFPPDNWIPNNKLHKMAKILPPRAKFVHPKSSGDRHVDEYELKHFDVNEDRRRQHLRQRSEAYDSDDDEAGGPGGQRVQCAQH